MEETSTPRQRIRALLERGGFTAREISELVSVSEREVGEHLEHLKRSLRREGAALTVEPAACLGCGFEFKKRVRTRRPGRCPVCKSERIRPPRFSIG